MAAEPAGVRRSLDELLAQTQLSHSETGEPPRQGSVRATAPDHSAVLREPILQERFMFEHYIGGRWCRPAADRYLIQRAAADHRPGGSVARADGKDVAVACTAARQAAGDWSRRGRAVRRAELGQVPARIAAQSLPLALAQQWDQDWDQKWDHHGDQAASVPGLDLQCAERQAARLRDIVRSLPSPPQGRQRSPHLPQAPAVAKLAYAADLAPAELFRTLLPLLYDGRTALVLLLYRDPGHLPVRLLQLLGIVADAMPPGVLNVLTGLGLEAGVALIRQRCDASDPAARL